MNNKILSVFVDESGKFQYPDLHSRFYIVGMHDILRRLKVHEI